MIASFTTKGEVTADGRVEVLTFAYRRQVDAITFQVSFVIADDAAVVLYRVGRFGASQDAFFGTDGREIKCSGYESCKKRYYFQHLPKAIFAVLKQSPVARVHMFVLFCQD